jgi:transcription elongation factor GreB
MSKAFTRESDDTEEQEAPSLRPQLPPGITNYVTPEWADRLRQQLQQMIERKQALTSINSSPARDGTDLRKLETEMRRLKQSLESAVMAERPADQGKVAFGATVAIKRGPGEEETYRIVGLEEADPDRGTISWISPLAKALIAKRAGDKVRFRSPVGEEELTILAVQYL